MRRLLAPVGADRGAGQAGQRRRRCSTASPTGRAGDPRGVQRASTAASSSTTSALRGGARLRRVDLSPDARRPRRVLRPGGRAACRCSSASTSTSSCTRRSTARCGCPSGGSLIIEHTEALTVIDVNTGKNVGHVEPRGDGVPQQPRGGRRDRPPAAPARHRRHHRHRLHRHGDPGEPRRKVVEAFREALARDKTRTQVFDISELGLVEMTRKRIGEGLLESFADLCPDCEGRGVHHRPRPCSD